MRDDGEHDSVTKRVQVIKQLVDARGIAMTELASRGEHRLARIASIIVPTDWASVYAALAMGIDPTPIAPIVQLKAGLH
jgi:glucose/mannose-6-phosphate isomerase